MAIFRKRNPSDDPRSNTRYTPPKPKLNTARSQHPWHQRGSLFPDKPAQVTQRMAEKKQAKEERTTRRRIHKRNKRAAIREKLAAA